ncbi:MAG: NAD(P)H:quinone oxidoreductase [bacterium]
MPKLLVLFYSRNGNTAALADAIADGARSVRFSEVDVRRIEHPAVASDVSDAARSAPSGAFAARYQTLRSVEELSSSDAIILGSPSRHGIMCAEVARVLDEAAPHWHSGAFVNTVGSAFTSGAPGHGGHETTLWSIMTPMASLGMILVPPGYSDPVMLAGGSPYGATTTASDGAPDAGDLAAARHQGRRVAEVTAWITHAKSHHHAH